MDFKNFSLLIIAGGKFSNFGRDKRFIEVGGKKLLENILQKAIEKNFAQIFLCVEEEILPIQILSWKYEAKILVNKFKNSSLLAELATGLSKIQTDWALAISADMPFFDFDVLQVEKFSRLRAIIPVVEKKSQPLAAFYHKSLAEKFSQAIHGGTTEILDALNLDAMKKIPQKFVDISANAKIFFKIETRADLRLATGRAANLLRKVPVISVAVTDDESTFTENLIQALAKENISVGVIKNFAEEFNFEIEGAKKFQSAGAKKIAAISPQGWLMFQQTEKREDFLTVAEKFEGVDLILIESKIPVIQPALSLLDFEDIKADKKIVAIFSNSPEKSDEVFQFDLTDTNSAVKVCKFLMCRA